MAQDNMILGIPEGLATILIPVIITISLFFIGQMITFVTKKLSKRSESVSYRELILEWVEILEKPITQQIESCKEFSKKIGNSLELQPEVLVYNNFLIEKIDSIPIERYINTFVINTYGCKKEKYKKTYNLISQFDFIKRAQDEMLAKYETYHKGSEELMEEWNKDFITLDQTILSQSLSLKAANIEHPFQNEILQIVANWGRNSPNGQSSVINSKINLIEPLTKKVGQELKGNPRNDYAYNLDLNLQGLSITLRKLEAHNEGNKELFESISNNIDDSLKKLKEAKRFFDRETKLKCFLLLK